METSNSPNLRRLPSWRDLMLAVIGAALIWGMLRAEARMSDIRQRVDAVATQVAAVKDQLDDAADDLEDANQALDDIRNDVNNLGYAVLSGRQR
jgi:DNA anti-recombination protein RmuC